MPILIRSRSAILTVTALSALVIPAMASHNGSPASAQGAIQAISAADRKQGSEAHPQLMQEFGGAIDRKSVV